MLIVLTLNAAAQEKYSLQQALQKARTNNPILKTERFEIGIAETDIISAKLSPNPTFHNESLQLMQSEHFFPETEWSNSHNREMLWEISKPFRIAGQRKHEISVARKHVSAAEKSYSETERNLFLDVATKWLEVWTAQKQLDIIQIAKANIDTLLNTNQIRYDNEVITQTDLIRTELLAKQYAIQYRTVAQEVENRQEEFGFLLGVEKEAHIDTSDHFMLAADIPIDTLLAQSIKNRSDVQATKSFIAAAESNIKLQKSLAFPEPEFGFMLNNQHSIPHFGITLTFGLPIFNRNQGEIRKSYQIKEQAEQQLLTIQKQIHTETSVAFSNFRLQQQNLEDFEPLLQQSQTILDNVKRAYLLGGTTIIDFLEAQRSWLETQQQHYDALQSYRDSYILLLHSTGLINQLAQ